MDVVVFSTKSYDRRFLDEANAAHAHTLHFLEHRLTAETAPLASGHPVLCAFVNDDLGVEVLERLTAGGTRLVVLRAAGFNNVDVAAARRLGISVARVPAYSPHAVAEHAVALLLTLNRQLHRAHNRVREGNFALEGLLGFDLHGRTVGVVGTGQIGAIFARIMHGFGCHLLLHDPRPDPALESLGGRYVPLNTLFAGSDIISLHCPLTPDTRYLVNARSLAVMRRGVSLLNTGRGGLINTADVIDALKRGHIALLGLDVYEEEEHLFFEDLSGEILQDDVFARLLTFPNVLISAHQGFFTVEALRAIAETTLSNVSAWEGRGGALHVIPGLEAR